MKAESLYIHVPFCVKKCSYCDFFSAPYNEALSKSYVNALCKELSLRKSSAGILKAVYIGGGTPSLLTENCFRKIFKFVNENYKVSSAAEITVEVNPATVSESKIHSLVEFGVNRISMGVQSFNDDELKTLGRIHNSYDALKTIRLIKKNGIDNLSLDLIYGIPGQTLKTWHDSLAHAIEFVPYHISSYELTPEKDTMLYGLIETKRFKMPNEDNILKMYDRTIDFLGDSGYVHYEISNFSFPGYRCIHNLNYWERGAYLGVGAGAHSFVKGTRSKNIADIRKYIENLNNNILPQVESSKITNMEAVKEFIFLGLRKTGGISLAEAKKYGLNTQKLSKSSLIKEKYLEIKEDNLMLTRKGRVLSNTVIVKLFDQLLPE